jgi:predicted phage tail protein
MKVANTLLTDKMASQKSLEEKKSQVVDKIDKVIAKLQKEINDHMKMTSEVPQEADKYHSMAEMKMSKIKELREKHKAVAASKKQLDEKE